jgi:hypothetical protein
MDLGEQRAEMLRVVQAWINLALWWRIFEICSAVRFLGIIQRSMLLMVSAVMARD